MDVVKTNVNAFFAKKEPWQIASITASTTLLAVWLYQFITKEESKLLLLITVRRLQDVGIFVNLFNLNFEN
jgi:hypothetical protein